MGAHVLVIDDDEGLARSTKRSLKREFPIVTVRTAQQAILEMDQWPWWLAIVADLNLHDRACGNPTDRSGFAIASYARQRFPTVPSAIYTAYDDPSVRQQAELRCLEYIKKTSGGLASFLRRCASTAPRFPRTRDGITREIARTIDRLKLRYTEGKVLFVQSDALKRHGQLMTQQECASFLGIRVNTYKHHVSRILLAAEVFSLEELLRRLSLRTHAIDDARDLVAVSRASAPPRAETHPPGRHAERPSVF